MNRHGRPPISHETIPQLIGSTTTATGSAANAASSVFQVRRRLPLAPPLSVVINSRSVPGYACLAADYPPGPRVFTGNTYSDSRATQVPPGCLTRPRAKRQLKSPVGDSSPWMMLPNDGCPGDLRRGGYATSAQRPPKAVLHELCLGLTRYPAFDYESAAALCQPGEVCDQPGGQSPFPVSGSIPSSALTLRYSDSDTPSNSRISSSAIASPRPRSPTRPTVSSPRRPTALG